MKAAEEQDRANLMQLRFKSPLFSHAITFFSQQTTCPFTEKTLLQRGGVDFVPRCGVAMMAVANGNVCCWVYVTMSTAWSPQITFKRQCVAKAIMQSNYAIAGCQGILALRPLHSAVLSTVHCLLRNIRRPMYCSGLVSARKTLPVE